ncbi:MAG: mandelate racemase [Lactobacillus sp.]|jgi:L-alanine-DL-glutamate epimerase-like enolase superfamily enzyme|nr:mandelate racemase [Lactobacillus sp.]
MPTIKELRIFKLQMPLIRPLITNIRTSTDLHSLIFQLVLTDGTVGCGEAAENVKLTGENLATMAINAQNWAVELKGLEVAVALQKITHEPTYHAARYGIETALIDAIAQTQQLAMRSYLKLPGTGTTLADDTTISIMDTAATKAATQRVIAAGYKHIKYKVSGAPSEIDRILSVQDLLPEDVTLRIDPNQAWSYEAAVTAINRLQQATFKLAFIEQPVPVDQLEALRKLRQNSSIPIVADEAVFSFADARKIILGGYADMINIKLIKCGGPLEAIKIADFAAEHHVNCLFGCTAEVNVALTMAACLSAGLKNVKYIDLDGLDYVTAPPFTGGITSENGQITLPRTPGLGITLVANSTYLSKIS